MCAATAGQRGRRVLLVDHAEKLAEKIRISGGGRCNFTNRRVAADNYLCRNPHFVRSAPVALHGGGFYRACTAPRHRFPRKGLGPTVLRRFRPADHRHAAGRMQRRWRRLGPCRRRCSRCRAPMPIASASSSTPASAASPRTAWSWPPAACRFRRSAPVRSVTASPSSSAWRSSPRARRWCR
ncbi:NAD(P)/FAD-dependent oxidoreductase [Thauera humireducens]|uniref:NAD(P)/FAD-dependent oxidoreductase n=1 Tax=Thauera humireducens TaxID=1134435 RepID=UPI003C74665A